MKFTIKLGDKVKDKLTGFEGVVTARAEYLDGCVRYQIQPRQLQSGKMIEAEWIDVNRLSAKGTPADLHGLQDVLTSDEPPGGPESEPPSRDP